MSTGQTWGTPVRVTRTEESRLVGRVLHHERGGPHGHPRSRCDSGNIRWYYDRVMLVGRDGCDNTNNFEWTPY